MPDVAYSAKRKFHELKLKTLAKHGRIIDLSIINPDLQPAREIIDKFLECALQVGAHRYSSAQGSLEIRQAASDWYRNKYNVHLDPNLNITIAAGSTVAIANIISAYHKEFQTSPTIILPQPTFSRHIEICKQSGAEVSFYQLQTSEDSISQSIISQFQKHPNSILILNTPNNPTGIIHSKNMYNQILPMIPNDRCWVVNDFSYADFQHGTNRATSLIQNDFKKNPLIEVYGMAKGYCLPGWRLSICAGNHKIIQRIVSEQTEINYGGFLAFQKAAAYALTASRDLTAENRDIYVRRWQKTKKLLELKNFGFAKDLLPLCFIWAELPSECMLDAEQICETLLSSKQVALQPGIIFGSNFKRFIRVSLTASDEDIEQSITKLLDVIEEAKGLL